MLVVYLDTNHLSRFAREPDHPTSRSLRETLGQGDLRLGISWIHLHELSNPRFASRAAVGNLLDQTPVAWAPSPDVVFEREIRWGIERALSDDGRDRQVFTASFEHAMGAPPDANIPISRMLEAMAETPELRTHLLEAAEYGLAADRMKKAAAIVRNPEEPILAHIRELNQPRTPAGLHLPSLYPAEDILRRAGGLSGFPATNVAHSLARIRLNDDSFRTRPNDLLDEWHACYTPYTVAVALDRGTAARFRMTRLPEASRVAHRLEDIPAILRDRLTAECT